MIVKPGDEIALKGGVKVTVVASEAKFIDKPVNGGGPNPLCETAAQMTPAAGENQRTVGVLVSYNNFTYLNTIDIDWGTEMILVCPINKLGAVTVFQTGRHGAGDGANAPGFIGAIKPQVVVVNNGPRKGFGASDDRVKPIAVPGKTFAPYERVTYLRFAKNPPTVILLAGLQTIPREYYEAAEVDGANTWSRLRHITLPLLMPAIVVEFTVRLGYAVFAVVTLAFLGFGIAPPTPDWGTDIAANYSGLLAGYWWQTLFPALAIASLVTAVTLIADSIEQVLSS